MYISIWSDKLMSGTTTTKRIQKQTHVWKFMTQYRSLGEWKETVNKWGRTIG